MNKHDLYEICVQSPDHLVRFLTAVHGSSPRVLGEDFAGTGALSKLWTSTIAGGVAFAVDHDAITLQRAQAPGVTSIVGDVRDATNAQDHACDVIFVGNFSIGELHTRSELLDYLRHVRARMQQGGVFVCDTYGGDNAFHIGDVHRTHFAPDGKRIRYTWQQRKTDPLTGMVENALHFRVDDGGMIEQEFNDAFVYRWRLWSVPELRDAMAEAGFVSTEVYADLAEALDDDGNAHVRPVQAEELDDSFIVCIAGRASLA